MISEAVFETSNPLGALESLSIKGFTVFDDEEFAFCDGINLIIGENGAGKSHLLKLAYASSRALYPALTPQSPRQPAGKEVMGRVLADKLVGVFLPDSLGRLCRRGRGRQRCEIALRFRPVGSGSDKDLSYSFSTQSSAAVAIDAIPSLPESPEGAPIYLPTRELISLSPDFARDYPRFSTRFDETYYDLSLALIGGLRAGKRSAAVNDLVQPLESAMGGALYVEKGSGRVYLKSEGGANLEMPLLAEGQRKIAMLAFLILNGAMTRRGAIYWDEPETNLNPKLMVGLVTALVELAAGGVQIFIATHSLFLTREIALQLGRYKNKPPISARYFLLEKQDGGVKKQVSEDVDDLFGIPALDAALAQDDALERLHWEGMNA